jgi:hypothetical protein
MVGGRGAKGYMGRNRTASPASSRRRPSRRCLALSLGSRAAVSRAQRAADWGRCSATLWRFCTLYVYMAAATAVGRPRRIPRQRSRRVSFVTHGSVPPVDGSAAMRNALVYGQPLRGGRGVCILSPRDPGPSPIGPEPAVGDFSSPTRPHSLHGGRRRRT